MKWFKFYGQDWLTDLKVVQMSMEDRLLFVTLLCLSSVSDDGVIKNCDEDLIIRLTNIPYDQFKKDSPYKNAKGFLQRLVNSKMITRNAKNDVTVVNFARRQGENLSGYERVKGYRDRKKMALNKDIDSLMIDNNDNVRDNTNDNTRIDKNRIEKNRKENTILAEQSSAEFNIEEKLQKMEKTPNSYLDIIASFIREKPVKVENSKQLSAVISRFARVAQKLSGAYTNEQIFGAAEKIKKENKRRENRGDEVDWTLETILKTLTK